MNTTGLFVTILVVCGVILTPIAEADDCYEAWSRCTGWSSGATGILWKTCAGRCQKCRGRSNGQCVYTSNGQCGARQQCQCSGAYIPRSTNWLDRMTCRMGL